MPLAFETGDLGGLCSELDRLLSSDADPASERLVSTAEKLLRAPELAHVDRLLEIKTWMAQIIAWSFPKSDPLVPLAIERFRWTVNTHGWQQNYLVERILQRADDLVFVRCCAQEWHPHHRAWCELRGAPRRRLRASELSLSSEISAFFKVLNTRYTLEADLNQEQVEWWRGYLHGPHLPATFWGIMVTGTFVLALAGLVIWEAAVGREKLPQFLVAAPVVAAGGAVFTFVTVWLWAHGSAARRDTGENRWERRTARGTIPRIGGALLLPMIAALLPANGFVTTAVALTTICLAGFI